MYSYIGFFIVLFLVFMYVFYIANKKNNIMEGLEGLINVPNVASSAKDYVAKLTTENQKMKNIFLIGQYKKDYEKVIIQMDDYINYVSMLHVLQLDTENKEEMTKQLSILNSLQDAKKSLNEVMRFIDKQK